MKPTVMLFVFCSIGITSCYDVDKYVEKRRSDENPQVVLLPASGVPANGTDLTTVKLRFPVGPAMDCTLVNFSTNEGVFIENKKPEFSSSDYFIDSDGKMTVFATLLSTTNPGRFLVTVKTESFKISVPVMFNPSFPNKITTDENKFAVKAGLADEIQLFANVKAVTGLPNKGTKVKFVVDGNISSDDSKWFRALTTTDTNGQASVFFSPGGLGTTARQITYQAIAVDQDKKEISGDGIFDLIP